MGLDLQWDKIEQKYSTFISKMFKPRINYFSPDFQFDLKINQIFINQYYLKKIFIGINAQ